MKARFGRTVLSVTVAGILFGAGFAHAETLGLQEAVSMAKAHNERVQEKQEAVARRRDQYQESLGRFLPTITLSGGYTAMNEELRIDLDPIRNALITMQASNMTEFANVYSTMQGAALTDAQRAAMIASYAATLDSTFPAFAYTLKDREYPSASVSAVQPLFTGGKLVAANRAAKAQLRGEEAALESERQQVTGEAAERYLTVVFMQQVVNVREDVLAGMEKHRDQAVRLLQQGMIAPAEKLRAEVAVSEAERNLAMDRNNLNLAVAALRSTLAVDADKSFEIPEELNYIEIRDTLSHLFEVAERTQPILAQLANGEAAAKEAVVVQRADFLTQVAGFGKYEMYPEYLSAMEPRWVVGVRAELPLFTGTQRIQRTQAAKHQLREVEAMRGSAWRQIRLAIEKEWRDQESAGNLFQHLEADVALAEENLRQNEVRFAGGMCISLEVIDARLVLQKIQMERLQAMYSYYRSYLGTWVAVGDVDHAVEVLAQGGAVQ